MPRDAPCIEVDDVRAAISACVDPPADRIVCPRSLEHACSRYAAEVPPCAPTTAETAPYRVGWADIAFGIATYNAQHEQSLLAAAGETWLPAAAGADLLLVTDADDPRSDDEIAPRVAGGAVAVHVHRCPRCRGSEGWLARTKVLELFREAERRWPSKLYFAKFDADSLPIPHHLLRLLDEMHAALGAAQPWLLGSAACRGKSASGSAQTFSRSATCHAAGGAGYVLSRAAARALGEATPDAAAEATLFAQADAETYGGEDAVVALGLRGAAGVRVLNCGAFYQFRPDQYANLPSHQTDGVRFAHLSPTPVSFHTIKHAPWLRHIWATLQARNWTLNEADWTAPAAEEGEGAADEEARVCDTLTSCEACTLHSPRPPPDDVGVRCVWCAQERRCAAFFKRGGRGGGEREGKFPCKDAVRPGGGYPGGAVCRAD